METSYYSKIHTKEDDWVQAEKVYVCSSSSVVSKSVNHRNQYPGMRRTAAAGSSPFNNNADMVLVKTAGNALKAMRRQDLLLQSNSSNSAEEETVLSVIVPANMQAGDALHVQAPDGRIIAVTIPPGLYPGQSFMVKVPPSSALVESPPHNQPAVLHVHAPPPPPPLTDSIPFSQALNSNYATTAPATSNTGDGASSSNTGWSHTMSNMFSHHSNSSSASPTATNNTNTNNLGGDSGNDDSLILVRVPAGYGPGAKLHVQVPDGRLVEATVPPGNVQEFYIRLPPPPAQQALMPVARPIFP